LLKTKLKHKFAERITPFYKLKVFLSITNYFHAQNLTMGKYGSIIQAEVINMPERAGALGVQAKPPEAKKYPPEQILTPQEIRSTGDNFIHAFIDLFKEDPDVQASIVKAFFDYTHGGRSGAVVFQKGTGRYLLNTTSRAIPAEDRFDLVRTEGDLDESLSINRGKFSSEGNVLVKPSISYLAFDPNSELDVFKRYDDKVRTKNNGTAVDKARELLAKTQKDFGKSSPALQGETLQR